MASYDYSPLAPVYKESNDSQIELQDVATTAPAAADAAAEPSKCKTECEKYWKNRRCCGTAEETRGRRIARCVMVTFALVFTFWLLAGTGALVYVGVKVHRCVHPNHVEVVTYNFSPSEIKTVELALVSGRVTVRSCSKAQNVSLVVRNYAPSLDLLRVMNVMTMIDQPAGLHRTSIASPSFDFSHCQHSWIEVVVPHNAKLDIKAHALLGHIDIEAEGDSVNNLAITGRVAGVKISDSKLAGSLSIESELGYVRVRDLEVAEGVVARVRVGSVSAKDLTAKTVEAELHIGHACVGNVKADSLTLQSEFAYVSAWNLDATKVAAHVEYGRLSVQTVPEFKGHFAAVSPYGYLSVAQGKDAEAPVYAKNNEAAIDGTIGVPAASGVIVSDKSDDFREFSLSSIYGAVNFFVPNPHTSYWHSQHDQKDD